MIIDAKNAIAGRLATFVAKKAMLGEGVSILNSEKAIVSGYKKMVLNSSKKDFDRGIPTKGPFIPKQPDRYLKRIIRGMLPYKQPKGESAFKRIKCYIGVPHNFKDQKVENIEFKGATTLKNYTTLKDICKNLGGK